MVDEGGASAREGEVFGGISSGEQPTVSREGEIVGGLTTADLQPEAGKEKVEYNPMTLIDPTTESASVSELRDHKDEIYNGLRRLQVLPDNNPAKIRYNKIMDVLGTSVDDWESSHPDEKISIQFPAQEQ